jgi:chemotaxis signal transduction protein
MLHVVLARIADRLYAVPSSHVVEVIPRVQARRLPQAPEWVLGWIDYRGRLILLVDLAHLLGGDVCVPRMSNRILVVRTGQAEDQQGEQIGLLVEAVQGSGAIDFREEPSHARLAPPAAAFLTTVTLADSEMVQLIDPRKLPKPFAEPGDV